jgi:hypothetical protein
LDVVPWVGSRDKVKSLDPPTTNERETNTMDVKVDKLQAWFQWLKICGGDKRFASHQWRLFWKGVRDGQLHDNCVWLSDVFGYNAKKS